MTLHLAVIGYIVVGLAVGHVALGRLLGPPGAHGDATPTTRRRSR